MMLKKLTIVVTLATTCLLAASGVAAFAMSGAGPIGRETAEGPNSFAVVEIGDGSGELPAPAPDDDLEEFPEFPAFVVKSIPATGANDVDPDLKEIKLIYSKTMRDKSWSWSTFGDENYPKINGAIRYEKDLRTAVLPVKLVADKTYAIFCNSPKFGNFKDAGGRSAIPYFLAFRTKKK